MHDIDDIGEDLGGEERSVSKKIGDKIGAQIGFAAQIGRDLAGALPTGVVITPLEKFRDYVLIFMLKIEVVLLAGAALGGIAMLVFVVAICVLLFPVLFGLPMGALTEEDPLCNISQYNQSLVLFPGSSQYPPRVEGVGAITEFGMGYYVARWCTPAQFWFNVCIKFFGFFLGYINLLQLPWTLSIFAHATCPRDVANKVGVDFYGRASESLWFHLPQRKRAIVASLLVLSLGAQTLMIIFHLTWLSYLAGQTWPGAFLQNIWIPLQIGGQVGAQIVQGKEEAKLREQYPGRFPPAMDKYLKQAYNRWLDAHGGKRGALLCGEGAFLQFVRAEMADFQKESAKFGKVGALSGIQAEAIDDTPDVRRDTLVPEASAKPEHISVVEVVQDEAAVAAEAAVEVEVGKVAVVVKK